MPVDEQDLIARIEQAKEVSLGLDWRLQDIVVTAVHTLDHDT